MDGGNTVNSFVMLLKTPLEHGRTTWQHGRNVQNHADVNVTLHGRSGKKKTCIPLASLPMPLGVAVEGRAVRHCLIHASRLVREAASRLMCSRKGHMLSFFQQWAYKRPTSKGQQSGTHGVLTCNQHNVDVAAGLQVLMQCGSLVSLKTIRTRTA